MPDKDPLWQRIVGGLLGVVIVVGLIFFARSRGATGEDVQRWQKIVVYTAAAGWLAYLVLVRRKR